MKWPKLNLKERFKGGFWASGTSRKAERINPGQMTWEPRCQYYDRLVQRHPLAKSCINTVAGQVMAEGLFLAPRTDDNGDPYERTVDACAECNNLNEQIGLDLLLFDTVITLGKFGSCFWEITRDPTFDVRIIPQQELIEPAAKDDLGNITLWRQGKYGLNLPEWNSEEIVHFGWNVTSTSWPYGTSLLEGLDTEFQILEQLEIDIKEHWHKVAFPREMWQVGDGEYMPNDAEVQAIKNELKDWEPGEHHVTSYKIDKKSGGVGDREVRGLDEVLTFLKGQIVDGLMTPPVSFQTSSTYASSKEMMIQQRANLIVPIQRLIKRKLENEVYKPYLEILGYSVKQDLPHVTFEDPEAFRSDVADYYTKLVATKIMPPRYAAKKLGIPIKEFDAWVKEEEKKMQDVQQQKVQAEQATGAMPQRIATNKLQTKEGKSWKVTELDELPDQRGAGS